MSASFAGPSSQIYRTPWQEDWRDYKVVEVHLLNFTWLTLAGRAMRVQYTTIYFNFMGLPGPYVYWFRQKDQLLLSLPWQTNWWEYKAVQVNLLYNPGLADVFQGPEKHLLSALPSWFDEFVKFNSLANFSIWIVNICCVFCSLLEILCVRCGGSVWRCGGSVG